MRILFFGSTSDSFIVLKKLHDSGYDIAAVITQPPRPIGRKQILTTNPTEIFAKDHAITALSFQNNEKSFLYKDEDAVINTLESFKAELLISASYGQKIPTKTITDAKFGGLNVHPSLLPRWRGADPIPWQILADDHQTGATIVTLTEKMDEGKIIAQKKIPLTENDQREKLRKKLFEIGADLLVETLPDYLSGAINGHPQDPKHATTARRLTRQDGFIPWEQIQSAMKGEDSTTTPQLIHRSVRAFSPWPGVWTLVKEKRLKLIKVHTSNSHLVLDEVQWEGKTSGPYFP